MLKSEITISEMNLFYASTSDIIKTMKQLEKIDWSKYKHDDILTFTISKYERKIKIQYTNAEWIKFCEENPEFKPSEKNDTPRDRYIIILEEV